ncbi:hypothetical protein EDD18DRAFT_1169064 [Armillaria luteobubalina]|uniref:Uncharacterized protein n=1 Tax=Armillaria luteobubalina TaxID=153913 RepID=A0AA39Q4M0_9AGAR|nr:hypothetical protein EDD18DRAFT_1169064 [Armillaria luteobubalina]
MTILFLLSIAAEGSRADSSHYDSHHMCYAEYAGKWSQNTPRTHIHGFSPPFVLVGQKSSAVCSCPVQCSQLVDILPSVQVRLGALCTAQSYLGVLFSWNMALSYDPAQCFEGEFINLDMPQNPGRRTNEYLEDSMFFDMFFEDPPPSESAFVKNFVSFGSGSLYHPYTDIFTLEVAIIGVLRIPGLYRYAIRLHYTREQRLWLASQDLQFEGAVLDCRVNLFFEHLYEQWFCTWPPDDTVPTENDPDRKRADKEQQKIEIFTLYIMVLHHRWIELSSPPEGWMTRMVYAKLDELEDMITEKYMEVQHYFTPLLEPAGIRLRR